MGIPRIGIVMPVYENWSSCLKLLRQLGPAMAALPIAADLLIVDDGSRLVPSPTEIAAAADTGFGRVEVLRLASNLGNQRAIAIGLSDLVAPARGDDAVAAVLVMDGDGEDRPEDAVRLIERFLAAPAAERVVVGQRVERSEGVVFRAGYVFYRLVFRLLTGRSVAFGNFLLMPAAAAWRLAHSAHLWNHVAAAVLRERQPIEPVACPRGTRLDGRSAMDLAGYIAHGLSAVSVFADIALSRVLIATVTLSAATILALFVVVVIRFFAEVAIPGWATTTAGILLLLFALVIGFVITTMLTMLSGRASATVLPVRDGPAYIAERFVIVGRPG